MGRLKSNERVVTDSSLDIAPIPTSQVTRTSGASTTCVIVTYGRRLHLLKRTVAAVQQSPSVARIIVVDNGCDVPVSELDFAPAPPVYLIRLSTNFGSAGGFHAGVVAAQNLDDSRFVLLLDDDNVGEPGFLERLIALHDAMGSNDMIGLCGLRRHRGVYPTLLSDPRSVAIPANSFMNFHLGSLPARLWRKVRSRRANPDTEDHGIHLRRIETAPYGGLLLPIAALRRTAPPDQAFIVYSDDHDYSLRLMDAGISLYLTDVGCINDAEESWDKSTASARSALISSTSPPWRIYYACRNRMLIEQRYITMPLVYQLNRRSYLAILALQALLQRRSFAGMRSAMRPLLRGITDGDDRRLGVHADYPLPSWSSKPSVRPAREVLGTAHPRMDWSNGV